jgi:hypothetical protein
MEIKQEFEDLAGLPVDLIPKRFANPIVMVRARKDFVHVAG